MGVLNKHDYIYKIISVLEPIQCTETDRLAERFVHENRGVEIDALGFKLRNLFSVLFIFHVSCMDCLPVAKRRW